MKILLVHELFMPDFSGGGEQLVYKAAKHLQSLGHQVKVLTTGDQKIKSYQDIETIRLPINRYLLNFSFLSILKHAKWADVIQTTTYNAAFPSWLVGKLTKKPVFCLVMSFWGKQWKNLRPKFKGLAGFVSRIIEKIQVGRSFTKLIFLSDFSYNFAKQNGLNWLNDKNSIIINPGVEIDKFKQESTNNENKNQSQINNKENYVLFSGRLAKQKGVYDLLKVAQKLPNIKFKVMGSGEEELSMRKIVEKESLSNVELVGFKSKDNEEHYNLYKQAKVFFLPSYGETFGFVLVEAMAAGCAVVSTMPLGYQGKVTKIGAVDEMVQAISELMQNQELCQKYGAENQEIAKKFNWNNFAKELEFQYKSALKK